MPFGAAPARGRALPRRVPPCLPAAGVEATEGKERCDASGDGYERGRTRPALPARGARWRVSQYRCVATGGPDTSAPLDRGVRSSPGPATPRGARDSDADVPVGDEIGV